MKTSQYLTRFCVALFSASFFLSTYAQTTVPVQPIQTTPVAEMADAEVRKIDAENLKITLKHGEIKNLDMPGMTMVFQLKDVALVKDIKVGDKIKFAAEKQGRNYVVTQLELAK